MKAAEFFRQTESEKLKVKRGEDPNDVLGYVPFGTEGLSNSDLDSDGIYFNFYTFYFLKKYHYLIYVYYKVAYSIFIAKYTNYEYRKFDQIRSSL